MERHPDHDHDHVARRSVSRDSSRGLVMAGKTEPRSHALRLVKGLGLIAWIVVIGRTAAQAQSLPQRVVGTPAPLLANSGCDVGNGSAMPIGWAVSGPAGSATVINRQADRTAGVAS